MTGQVLNSFGIYPSIYQVRDICMPQLVRRHLKVQAVHHLAIMRSLFTENRCDCVLDFLTVHIPHVGAFLISLFGVLDTLFEKLLEGDSSTLDHVSDPMMIGFFLVHQR